MPPNSDSISLYSLALSPNIGLDHWGRQRPQPVLLTLHAHTSLARAGSSDNVAESIHYGHLSTAIDDLQARAFPSLLHLAEAAADVALSPQFAADEVHVLAEAPKLLLRAHSLSVELVRSPSRSPRVSVHINELSIYTIIGVNPPERLQKQLVITTISFLDPTVSTSGYVFPHGTIAEQLTEHIEFSHYLTLEAFATSVARVSCFLDGMDLVTIKAQKPSAVSFGHSSGVQMTRNRAFFQRDAQVSTLRPTALM